MASQNLLAVLFALYFSFGYCATSLEQPSILSATVGSTINLNCHLKNDEQLTRINLYWFSIGLNGTLKKYLYPPPTVTSSINSASSVSLVHPKHSTDMSLSVSNLTLAHTDTYVCHVSLVFGMNNSAVSGSGTFLLMHKTLEISLDETDLICTTNVQTLTNVTLVWELENGTLVDGDPGWLANSDNSYWISNTFPKSTSLCQPSQNATFTCLLQYKGTTVAWKRMEVPCAGETIGKNHTGLLAAHQPVLLYSFILGSSLLILLVLLLVWIKNKWIFRTNPDSSLYTNISDLKRTYCL